MGMKAYAFLLLSLASPLSAIAPVELLDREIRSFNSDVSPDSFALLCQHIQHPCGLEELESDDPSLAAKPLGKVPADQNIRGALDAIVARAPKYLWIPKRPGEPPENVLNLEPKEIPKDDPLEKRIMHLSLKNMSSTRAALTVLHAANALGSFQAPRDFRLRRMPDIEVNDVSVREALNKIVVADDHAIWVASPTKKSGALRLSFRIWDNNVIVLDNPELTGAEYDQELKRIQDSLGRWNVRTTTDREAAMARRPTDDVTAVSSAKKKIAETLSLRDWRDASPNIASPKPGEDGHWHVEFKKAPDLYLDCDVELKTGNTACQPEGGS